MRAEGREAIKMGEGARGEGRSRCLRGQRGKLQRRDRDVGEGRGVRGEWLEGRSRGQGPGARGEGGEGRGEGGEGKGRGAGLQQCTQLSFGEGSGTRSSGGNLLYWFLGHAVWL